MFPVEKTNFTHLEKVHQGKVRDIYAHEDAFLMVTSDRISAFDYVLSPVVPFKGIILNQIALYWFEKTKHIISNHIISSKAWDYPKAITRDDNDIMKQLAFRSMYVKKAQRLDIECVVRGYLSGSGYKEYQADGTVCGIELEDGLVDASKLSEPIFTPAFKSDDGHDENISFERMVEIVGLDLAEKMKKVSIQLYNFAAEELAKKNIILADTKFEFGLVDGELILIDEILTPDSSRYWSMDTWKPGATPPSYDKQFIRDYLSTTDWDKNSEPPVLPTHIVAGGLKRYIQAYEVITDQSFAEALTV